MGATRATGNQNGSKGPEGMALLYYRSLHYRISRRGS